VFINALRLHSLNLDQSLIVARQIGILHRAKKVVDTF
jgi:hypothetical protein